MSTKPYPLRYSLFSKKATLPKDNFEIKHEPSLAMLQAWLVVRGRFRRFSGILVIWAVIMLFILWAYRPGAVAPVARRIFMNVTRLPMGGVFIE